MRQDLPLFPEQASTLAGRRSTPLYFFLVAVSLFFAHADRRVLIVIFAVRYRRRRRGRRGDRTIHGLAAARDRSGSVIPLVHRAWSMFVWGAKLFFAMRRARRPTRMEIYVVGKQWMWKLQHPEGQREINELHVPVGAAGAS